MGEIINKAPAPLSSPLLHDYADPLETGRGGPGCAIIEGWYPHEFKGFNPHQAQERRHLLGNVISGSASSTGFADSVTIWLALLEN